MKKLFRKIHLWLSVPLGILITLICFSGAMLVYEKEITGVTVSPDAKRAYQVSLSQPRRASLYVDQYTGEVKGQSEKLPFFSAMLSLHRWLMGAAQSASGGMSVGKFLVGLSTLLLVIIVITGILMWLTNRKKPLTKSLTISFTKGWPRFWHDLHVAGGIYATILLLAMSLTGLTWSFGWYRTSFYSLFGVEASAEGGHGHGGGQSSQGDSGRGDRANGVPEGRNSLRAGDSYTFDTCGGQLSDCKPYAEQPRSTKLHGWIYTWHVGSWGGAITRLLTFLSSLVGATLPLTGYYLWIRRLQRKKTQGAHPEK